MKFTVVPVELAGFETVAKMRAPGHVRHIAFGMKEKKFAIDLLGRNKPAAEEVVVMFVEVSPEGEHVERRFLVLESGGLIETKDGYVMAHVGSAISPGTGRVAHVYEVKAIS